MHHRYPDRTVICPVRRLSFAVRAWAIEEREREKLYSREMRQAASRLGQFQPQSHSAIPISVLVLRLQQCAYVQYIFIYIIPDYYYFCNET